MKRRDEPAMHLDSIVTLAGGRTKRLRDCTADDLGEVAARASMLAARAQAQGDALRSGQTPACDFEFADGTFCAADASHANLSGSAAAAGEPLTLCPAHYLEHKRARRK